MRITEEKVWMKYYPDEVRNLELPKCSVYDFVKQRNHDRLDVPALHYYGNDISFRELFRRVEETANAYAACGVKAGDVVSFLSVQIPETIASVYALNKLGAVANTIDPRMDVASIEQMIRGAGSRILVVINIAFPKVRDLLDRLGLELVIVQSPALSLPPIKKGLMTLFEKAKIPYAEKVIRWSTFMNRGRGTVAQAAPYVGDAAVAITYTGGTTGTPKGVVLTNDSMNSAALNFIYCDVVREDDDRFLGIIPIFSAYGMVCGMHMPLCMRVTLVPIPRFVPDTIGKLVKTYRPNHMISTPVFIEILMQSREVRHMDLSFLRTLASGGDTMNEGLEAKLEAFRKEHNMHYPLAQGYGMSELSAAASFCVNRVYKPGSVGIPSLTTTVGIFDPDTGEEKSYYEEGEVCATGLSMMKCYYREPEETANVMRKHADGRVWIHSGDVGYMDSDGFLYIKGRIKRMITRFDGHKVFPINLESLVGAREDVRNCAVIGVADLEHSQGQYPIVLVEVVPGCDPQNVCKEIFDFCQTNIEERGKPVAVLPLEEIPLTGMGKNDYRMLEQSFGHFNYRDWKPASG